MIRVDTLHPSQEIFSHVGTFPGLNQYLIEHNMYCTRTQHGASREIQTNDSFISSRALYHWLALQVCTAIRSLYRHVVCDVPVSCKANGDRNQLWAWLDSDPKAD